MEVLYHTKVQITFEEYKKYILTLSKPRLLITGILLFVFFMVIGTLTRQFLFYFAAVLLPVLEYFSTTRPLKKVYYSNKLAVNSELEYDFYDSYFMKKSRVGEERIEYSKLYKIIETKTNFYLMIASNQGYMLIKENMPDGMDVFLRKLKI